jgi:Ca2+-binding EF-hand superfamily protein
MVNGIGSASSAHTAQLSKMLKKLDTNGDNSISRDEFVAGAPKDGSATKAGNLFDSMDTSKTGSLSASAITSAFQQMGSQMQASLIAAQSAGSQNGPPPPDGGPQGPQSPADMFAKLDTNGDGKVSRDEFVAGRPNNVSADQAGSFFDTITKDSGAKDPATTSTTTTPDDGLTQDQLTQGLEKAGGHGHHHHAHGGGGAGSSAISQLFTATGTTATTGTTTTGATSNPSPQSTQMSDQLMSAIGAYQKSSWNAGASQANAGLSI